MEKITKTNKDGIIKVVIEEIPEKQIRERVNRVCEEANEAVFGFRADQEIKRIKKERIIEGRYDEENDSIVLLRKDKTYDGEDDSLRYMFFNNKPENKIFIERLKKEFKIKW